MTTPLVTEIPWACVTCGKWVAPDNRVYTDEGLFCSRIECLTDELFEELTERYGCKCPETTVDDKTIARFWKKVDRQGGNACWQWLASFSTNGYGQFAVGHQRHVRAHRFAYELLVGPVESGLTLDHLCRNRACVNPAHLEPVTHRENTLRGNAPTARNAAKTECDYGHPFTPENTRIESTGSRKCRACARRRAKEARQGHDRTMFERHPYDRKAAMKGFTE